MATVMALTGVSCAAPSSACHWTPIAAPVANHRRSWRAPTVAGGVAALLYALPRNRSAASGVPLRLRLVAQAVASTERHREDIAPREIRELLEREGGGGLPLVPGILQEAIHRLRDEGDDGSGVAQYLTSVLDLLMKHKAYKMAVEQYLRWNVEVPLALDPRVSMMRLLGSYGNFQAAASHVQELLDQEEIESADASEMFNGILAGLIQAHHPLTSSRADVLIKEMVEAGLQPTADTLRLVVEAKTLFAAPGFLIDVGQSVLEIQRRFETALQSSTLLAISGAQMRSGDLDAAYRWFLASQLMENRQTLNEPAALELVSQLARALAIGGRASQLKRLLLRVQEDGGKLPSNAASVALSGFTAGRSLATCWLEPPVEVVRRRGIWSSTPAAQKQGAARVTLAEQWDWRQQEESRQEMYQWYPYLSPETKLERAWMTPLRSIDRGALGLALQWAGQTPAEAAARERLQDSAEPQPFDLEAALALEPPCSGSGKHRGRPIILRPEPRSWRMYHADAVKKAFPTSQRTRVGSAEELQELLLAEKTTRLMFGAKRVVTPVPYEQILEWVSVADETMTSRLQSMEVQQISKSKSDLVTIFAQLSGMSQQEIEEEKSLNPSKLRHVLETAQRFAKGDTSVPLSDEEYHDTILEMTDQELEEAYLKLKSSINDSIMGSDLTEQVEQQLLLERQGDASQWDGSATDELRLALDVAEALKDLGVTLSTADHKALLSAAFALNDAELADELLTMQMKPLVNLLEMKAPQPEPEELPLEWPLQKAQGELWKAMVQGGWDPDTTKDFLQGKRLVPMRDRTTALGQLQTKYLDPLQGLSSTAPAESLLAALEKPFEGKLKRFAQRGAPQGAQTREDFMGIVREDDGGTAPRSVSWEVQVPDPMDPKKKVKSTMQVTKTDVLEASTQHPFTAELLQLLRRSGSSNQLSKADVGKLLLEMGLPTSHRQDKKQELFDFVLRVLA